MLCLLVWHCWHAPAWALHDMKDTPLLQGRGSLLSHAEPPNVRVKHMPVNICFGRFPVQCVGLGVGQCLFAQAGCRSCEGVGWHFYKQWVSAILLHLCNQCGSAAPVHQPDLPLPCNPHMALSQTSWFHTCCDTSNIASLFSHRQKHILLRLR